MKIISLLFFLQIALLSLSQVTNEKIESDKDFSTGDSLQAEAKYDEAIVYFKNSSVYYEKLGMWKKVTESNNRLSENYIGLSDFKSAFKNASISMKICKKKLSSKSAELAIAHKNIGIVDAHNGSYIKALNEFESALKILGENHSHTSEIYNRIGNIYHTKGVFTTSLKWYEKGLKTGLRVLGNKHPEISSSYNNIGLIYYEEGEYFKALDYFKKAFEVQKAIYGEKSIEITESYNNIGVAYADIGDYTKALQYHQQALKILQSFGKDFVIDPEDYHNIATIYQDKEDYSLALEYYEKAISIQKKRVGEKNPLVATSYLGVGIVHQSMGDKSLTIKYFKKALAIFSEVLGNKHMYVANTYNNLADVYSETGSYNLALDYNKKAMALLRQLFGEKHPDVALCYDNFRRIYYNMGSYDLAILYGIRSIKVSEQVFGAKHHTLALGYRSIGEIYEAKGEKNKALECYQKSITANSIDEDSLTTFDAPRINNSLSTNELLLSLQNKASLLTSIYLQDFDVNKLTAAIDNFYTADSLIDKIRRSHLNHSDKIKLGRTAAIVFEGAIMACLEMYKIKKNKAYIHKAFYFSEKSKSGALKEALLDTEARNNSKIPQTLLELEKDLRLKISFYHSKALEEKLNESDAKGENNLIYEDLLFNANRTYDSLILSFEKNYPSYYQLKYQNRILTVNEIQKKLNKEDVLVEYFTGDKNIYIFTVTSDKFNSLVLDNTSELDTLIAQLRYSLNPENSFVDPSNIYKIFTENSFAIYDKFLKGALQNINKQTNLIIIPDGLLGYIPFDVLLTQHVRDSKFDYRPLPYLIHNFTTRYAYSASLLYGNNILKNNNSAPQFLAFAPSYSGNNISLTRNVSLGKFRDKATELSWNKPEVDNIGKHMQGLSLVGNKALEEKFKTLAHQYNVIHLAMHAFIDNENPMNSKLIFTDETKSKEDGLLNAYELYNLNLDAELAVLSACETGYGKLEKGEGIMSLARAFSYAGCKSIVMNLWLVDDEATASLMELFYKKLAEGADKDRALQLAKIEYLRQAEVTKQNPAFWGGFVMLGDSRPITSKSFLQSNLLYIIPGILLVMAIAAYLIFKNKQRSNLKFNI